MLVEDDTCQSRIPSCEALIISAVQARFWDMRRMINILVIIWYNIKAIKGVLLIKDTYEDILVWFQKRILDPSIHHFGNESGNSPNSEKSSTFNE